MKKLGLVVAGSLLAGVLAHAADPVTSVNVVGFNKVACERGKYTLVCTAFKSLDGSVLKSENVFSNQLPEGSTVFAYDASASPPAYVADTLTFLGWDANINYNGSMGLWIYVDPSAPNASYDVVFAGEVPMAATTTNEVYAGYNLMGYPYTADVSWTNTALAKKIEAIGEGTIFVYDPSTGYSGNSYTFLGWDDPGMILKQGKGFWVYTPSTQFTNVEVRPYNP